MFSDSAIKDMLGNNYMLSFMCVWECGRVNSGWHMVCSNWWNNIVLVFSMEAHSWEKKSRLNVRHDKNKKYP